MRKKQNLHRIGIYKIEEVLPYVKFTKISTGKGDSRCNKTYGDYHVKMNSSRYQLFATKGLECIKCGLKGQYFALEQTWEVFNKNGSSAHFNLYAIDSEGDEVLMTKDHILPKAQKGSEKLDNLQTMCCICNEEKGLKLQQELQFNTSCLPINGKAIEVIIGQHNTYVG